MFKSLKYYNCHIYNKRDKIILLLQISISPVWRPYIQIILLLQISISPVWRPCIQICMLMLSLYWPGVYELPKDDTVVSKHVAAVC